MVASGHVSMGVTMLTRHPCHHGRGHATAAGVSTRRKRINTAKRVSMATSMSTRYTDREVRVKVFDRVHDSCTTARHARQSKTDKSQRQSARSVCKGRASGSDVSTSCTGVLSALDDTTLLMVRTRRACSSAQAS